MAQNSMPAAAVATSIPREYARPGQCGPIAGVIRDGEKLIAPRGADLSAYCIACGGPSAGKPWVLRYVPSDGSAADLAGCADEPIGGMIALLFLAVYGVLSATVPRLRARRRALTVILPVGLCDQHRRQRRRILRAAGVALLLSLGLLLGGLWAWFRARYQTGDDTTVAQTVMIAGGVLAFLGPVLVLTRLRTPTITTAPDGRVLITGAGRDFVDAQNAVVP